MISGGINLQQITDIILMFQREDIMVLVKVKKVVNIPNLKLVKVERGVVKVAITEVMEIKEKRKSNIGE